MIRDVVNDERNDLSMAVDLKNMLKMNTLYMFSNWVKINKLCVLRFVTLPNHFL